MFIRNRDQALDAVAEIMELPERRSQIIRCTVGIMQCLDADPRAFLYDCQVLLIEGGLECLRRKRRDLMEQLDENIPVVVLDPEEDRLFEEVGSALDALRLSDVVREVFPALTTRYAPWEVARALLGREEDVQNKIREALKVRKSEDRKPFEEAFQSLEALIVAHRPTWWPREPRIRQACRDVLVGSELVTSENADGESSLLTSIIASNDERATGLLDMIERDPQAAVETIGKMYELMSAVRNLQKEDTESPTRNVA